LRKLGSCYRLYMTTPKLTIYLFLFTLVACGQKNSETKKDIVDPKAKQFNDSAVALIRSMKDEDSQKAILLLDEAIKIDSTYFTAYWNKLSLQSQLKQYDRAIETGKQILKLNKISPYYYFIIATFYYRIGDTISANNYFKKTLAVCDIVLDTMSLKNRATYEVVIMNKGVSLIFLGQQEEGNKILKQFYDSQTDTTYRMWTAAFMNKTKEEILNVLDGQN
jgi:tetratricopeptide (TPR) repeat protein